MCRKTAGYPPGARFKWNSEVLWPIDSYLRHATPEKQQQLVDAIRAGQVELHALYANELAGLCRPEELLRLMQCSMAIGRRCGVTVDAAMITDTPGCPWGMVPAMAQAGVKYFSAGIERRPSHRPLDDCWAGQALLLAGPRWTTESLVLDALTGAMRSG